MADNNTFVLFEEIKNKLETIYRELLTSSLKNVHFVIN